MMQVRDGWKKESKEKKALFEPIRDKTQKH
jgi:hypothetical protein